MDKFKELMKRSFDLWVKKRWLKEIDRAIDKYKKTYAKATREHYVMKKLNEEYKKIYGEDLHKNI
jgi:hypothetical protein